MGSVIPMTLGDQAGVLSPFMGPGMYTMGNPTVMVNALPAINLLCPTTGNNMVNPIGAATVPSITNVFYSDAAAPPPGEIDRAGIQKLGRALEPRAAFELSPDGIALATVPVFSPALWHSTQCFSTKPRTSGRSDHNSGRSAPDASAGMSITRMNQPRATQNLPR